ncbi:ExbD/TolR family protein [Terracidiphilus gabretensis]|jgi:biopolymer transport protein TolR|uniref:ExbD/TolR family protein n=1 Tax=Terracidiphilus gabretensis TaxID=1577687 RepID=UPI00071B842B|nr:biopolymer transporter ExbD [Terracidiphilus gabretensis]
MTMSKSTNGMQSEINVTPMIDVLLVLLIIFMVIVPIVSKGEQALAPKPATHSLNPPSDPIVLELTAGKGSEPDYRINNQAIAKLDLPARLSEIYAARADRLLFVKADDKLAFTQVAQAIDMGHAAGVEHVALITPGAAAAR